MRIIIDIGHPAHVHYFKNFVKIMEKKGHIFLIIARDKEVTNELLDCYNISFISRGKGGISLLGKLFYLLKANYLIFRYAIKFQPDIFLGFSSIYSSQVAFLLRRPSIVFDDTEHAALEHLMYKPFTNVILTPKCFKKDFGKKHIHFNGYMELCYLHPNYFTPDSSILELLKVKRDEKYVILRLVSWNASHDVGHSGLSIDMKHKVVNELSKYAKVFISSEGKLPEDLKKYQIKIPPEKMHDVLAFASVFIGEGATMASECAMLGTPAIYVNSLTAGTLEEQEKLGLIYGFRNSVGVLEKTLELLNNSQLGQVHQARRGKMLAEKIDVTEFMIWFVENYSESVTKYKKLF